MFPGEVELVLKCFQFVPYITFYIQVCGATFEMAVNPRTENI